MWINKTIIKPLAFSVFTYVCCIPKLNSTVLPNCYSCCVIKLWFIFTCSHNIYELQFFSFKLLNPLPSHAPALDLLLYFFQNIVKFWAFNTLGCERATDASRCVKTKHQIALASPQTVNQTFIFYRELNKKGCCDSWMGLPWIFGCSEGPRRMLVSNTKGCRIHPPAFAVLWTCTVCFFWKNSKWLER